MGLKPQVAKIVGRSREEVWGQVFASDNLFLVLEVSVPKEHEAAPLGKEIIDTFVAEFEKLSFINLKNLKKLVCLKEGSFLDLKLPPESTLNLLVCVLIKEIFYLLILGEGKAFLKRDDKIALLLKGQGSGSGFLREKDILVLASSKFNQVISFESLKATLDLDFNQRAENLAPLLHSHENGLGAAAMILEFEKEEEFDEKQTEGISFLERKPTHRSFLPKAFFSSIISKARLLVSSFKIKPGFVLKRKLNPHEQAKKTVLTVALILTALLFFSIVLGWGKRTAGIREERFKEVFDLASHHYEEGKALIDLNTQKSREVLNEAKKIIESAKEEFKKGSRQRREIEELLKKVETALTQTEKVYRFSEVPLFFDPQFLKDEAFGSRLGLYKDSLVILDKSNDTLYSLKVKEKSGMIVGGGDKLKGSKAVGIHGTKVYTIVNEGIVETDIQTKTSSLIKKRDEEWGEIVDLVAYGGNIYLLDKKGKIIKYLKTDEGFAKRDYLAPGQEIDFSSAFSMAIDGEVWVGIKRGVLRFALGEKKDFLVEGLKEDFISHLIVYTDEECKNVYLLEPGQKRIVVVNKEGQYQATYEWEKLSQGEDMVVLEKEKKILVLVEGKIYGVDLKS